MCIRDRYILLYIIARAACFCKMLVKNRFQPARPAGRPRANYLIKLLIFGTFFRSEKKWIFPEPITSSIRDFEATFFTSLISIPSACSSGRPLFARLRRPTLLVLVYLMINIRPKFITKVSIIKFLE